MLFRLILYDGSVYEDVTGHISVCGQIEGIKDGEGNISLTITGPDVIKGPKTSKKDKILVYYSSENSVHNLKIGQRIMITGSCKAFDKPSNPGEFDASRYYHNKGYSYIIFSEQIQLIDSGYNHVREGIRSITEKISGIYYELLPEDEAGIINGIVLGKRELISEEDTALYRKNGIMHLLAVSGMHVSTISMIILFVMSHTGIGFVKSRVIAALLLIAYGYMTGFSISCIRAVIMIIISIGARICGRAYDLPQSLSAAGIFILLISPKELFSVSFLLSFGSVCAVGIIAPLYIRELRCNVLKSAVTSLTVTLFTAPVIIYYYNDTSLYAFIINLMVIPLMTLLFIIGIGSVILYPLSPAAGMFLAGAMHFILVFYEKTCMFFEEHMYSLRIMGHISIARIIIYYLTGMVMYFMLRLCRRCIFKWLMYAMSVAACVYILSYTPAKDRVVITMIDVGQGDGILIEMPSDHNMMIDGGSTDKDKLAQYVLEPYMRYRGINHIDFWAVTHMDEDHVNGLVDICRRADINRITIGALILPDIADKSVYDELLSFDNVYDEVIYMGRDDMLSVDDVSFACLNPQAGADVPDDKNDDSLVLRMEYKEFNMLFTGDISENVEDKLSNAECCDILKVAHHGAKTSTSKEFLNRMEPDIAVISAGEGNSYGHPAPETVERLKDCGSRIYCTMDTGAIIISANGQEDMYMIDCYKK